MNDERLEIYLDYLPKDEAVRKHGYDGVISDASAYLRLCALFGKPQIADGFDESKPNGSSFLVFSDSKEYSEGLELLMSQGLKPAFTHRLRPDQVEKRFRIVRGTAPSIERLDACEYVCHTWCDAHVGYHYATETDTIVAMAEKAEFKKTTDIGDLAPSRRLAVSTKFIESFQAAGLNGAAFLPIEWRSYPGRSDVPDKPSRTHWLSAQKEMPRCLTPRVGFLGDLTGVHFWDNEQLIKHAIPHMACGWDDEGRRDFTLRFRRKEVEALGEFDIARTYEWIHLVGEVNPRWFPQLIVSQRFRQWAKKQRYKLHYGLCELVD